MAISTAAAVLGAAKIGAKVYSASKASSAAKSAAAAQAKSDAEQLAFQRDAFNTVNSLNQPFVQGGQNAYAALLQQFGIGPNGQTRRVTPAPQLSRDALGNVRAVAPIPSDTSAMAAKASGGVAGTSPVEQPYGGNAGQTNMSNPAYFSPGGVGGGSAGTSPAIPYDPAMDAFPMSPNSVGAGGAPIAGMGGGYGQPTYNATPTPDWNGYLTANPDVAAQAQREGRDPVEYAQAHYAAFGQNEGRQLPMTQPEAPVQDVQPEAPPVFDPNAAPDLTNAQRPDAMAPPTFTRGADPTAPSLSEYFDPSKFTADPGYQFRQTEALNGVNAMSAARGKLRSGDAAKALMGRASDLASQEYGNWFARQMAKYQAARGAYQYDTGRNDQNFQNDRAYGTGLWQYGTDRGDANFDKDRAFQVGQRDTNTNNMFRLVGVGTTAAGNVGNAAQNFANGASNISQNGANAAGDAAYNRAAATSYGVNAVANGVGNFFSNWGGGASKSPAVSWSGGQQFNDWAKGNW